jgi:hypothetical protein
VRAAWLEVVLKRFAEATSFASAKEMMTTLEQLIGFRWNVARRRASVEDQVDLREPTECQTDFATAKGAGGYGFASITSVAFTTAVTASAGDRSRFSTGRRCHGPLLDRAHRAEYAYTRGPQPWTPPPR